MSIATKLSCFQWNVAEINTHIGYSSTYVITQVINFDSPDNFSRRFHIPSFDELEDQEYPQPMSRPMIFNRGYASAFQNARFPANPLHVPGTSAVPNIMAFPPQYNNPTPTLIWPSTSTNSAACISPPSIPQDDNQDVQEDEDIFELAGKRWSDAETRILIAVWQDNYHKIGKKRNAAIWKAIAEEVNKVKI